jgi:hypothetical protein
MRGNAQKIEEVKINLEKDTRLGGIGEKEAVQKQAS